MALIQHPRLLRNYECTDALQTLKGTTTPHARFMLATRSLNGLHETLNGLHETLHAFPETLNGLHETLNGLHETFLTRNGLLAFHTLWTRFDFRFNRVLLDFSSDGKSCFKMTRYNRNTDI